MHRKGLKEASGEALTTSTTYRAGFRENFIFYPIISGFGALCLRASFFSTNDAFVGVLSIRGLGILLILLPWIIATRFFVTLDSQAITARGFFSTHRVEWSNLHEVIALGGRGGMGQGLYGPDVYRLQGAHDAIVLNLKFFSRECSSALFVQTKRLGIKIRYPRDI
jgi:hypothetical protein